MSFSKNLFSFLVLVTIVSLYSCSQEDLNPQDMVDDEIIQNYIQQNSLSATKHDEGFYYIITQDGNGEHPPSDAKVDVTYKGYFTNGNVFDEGTHQFELQNLITGWQLAIPLLSKGGSGTFLFPSQLGYGAYPPPGIPPNAVLIFDITLNDFE